MSKEKALNIVEKAMKDVEDTNFTGSFWSDSLTIEIKECIKNVRMMVTQLFGLDSSQFQEFEKIEESVLNSEGADEREEKVKDLESFLRSIKYEIENFWEDEKEHPKPTKFSNNKIFIIHGHDEGTKEKVARFLMQLNLEPIILHEKPNEGKTIIEKFEKHALNAGFAIALLTPDDFGGSRDYPYDDDSVELGYRARQNVILELGYFMGKLERKRVCVLYGKNVEIPSDYSGVLYIPLDKNDAWKSKLAKELKNAGFKIDMNKLV